MSLFGESATDQRDFRMGLAGLLAGLQSLRILAERGIASPEDIEIASRGIMDVLEMIPSEQLPDSQLAGFEDMLKKLQAAAVLNFGKV